MTTEPIADDSDYWIRLGHILRAARRQLGLSVTQIPGVGHDAVSRYERGKNTSPTHLEQKSDTLNKFLEAVSAGLSKDELTRRELLNISARLGLSLAISKLFPEPSAALALSPSTSALSEPNLFSSLAPITPYRYDWQRGVNEWSSRSREAYAKGDWATWVKGSAQAGQYAHNLGADEAAEYYITRITNPNNKTIGINLDHRLLAEGYIRLGWLRLAQNKYRSALAALYLGLKHLCDRYRLQPIARDTILTTVTDNLSILCYDPDNAQLLQTCLHLNGRCLSQIGFDTSNRQLVLQGWCHLELSRQIAERHVGGDENIGYEYLRQAPLMHYLNSDDRSILDRHLAQSRSLLSAYDKATGHLYLTKANIAIVTNAKQAIAHYEAAYSYFTAIPFYPAGVSTIFRRLSTLSWQGDRTTEAFSFALVAYMLYPYADNQQALHEAASATYQSLSKQMQAFDRVWHTLLESVFSMTIYPFSDLKHLIDTQGVHGQVNIDARLNRAERIVKQALK